MLLVCLVGQTDGCTPLLVASQNGHMDVMRALVGAGAAVNQARVRGHGAGCMQSSFVDCVCMCVLLSGFFLLAFHRTSTNERVS
jgi:hypothetical protein